MEADLGRLRIAVDVSRERIEMESRERYRIAGFDVPEPPGEEMSDDEFNAQIRETIARVKKRAG